MFKGPIQKSSRYFLDNSEFKINYVKTLPALILHERCLEVKIIV